MENNNKVLLNRKYFSLKRLKKIGDYVSEKKVIKSKSICMFAAGSYGRLMASKYSDLDLFFFCTGSEGKNKFSNLDKIEIDSELIKICRDFDLPRFSGDGEYLKIHYFDDVKETLGGPEDDYKNSFTVRMLLLLESYPVYNSKIYNLIIKEFVKNYYRDFRTHSENFRPVFLVNDIIRFWKTFCLNYEFKRNTSKINDQEKRLKAQIKNLKLKFSRMLTCYSMIIAISCQEKVDIEFLVNLVRKSPLQRLMDAVKKTEGSVLLESLIDSYCWFLKITDRPEKQLMRWIYDKRNKKEADRKADEFGKCIYEIIERTVPQETKRYLVI